MAKKKILDQILVGFLTKNIIYCAVQTYMTINVHAWSTRVNVYYTCEHGSKQEYQQTHELTFAFNCYIFYYKTPTTVYPVCGDLIAVLDRNRNCLKEVTKQHTNSVTCMSPTVIKPFTFCRIIAHQRLLFIYNMRIPSGNCYS